MDRIKTRKNAYLFKHYLFKPATEIQSFEKSRERERESAREHERRKKIKVLRKREIKRHSERGWGRKRGIKGERLRKI